MVWRRQQQKKKEKGGRRNQCKQKEIRLYFAVSNIFPTLGTLPGLEKEQRQPPEKPRLLLVDDEADIIYVLKRALELKGFEVEAFSSSSRALEAFRPNAYDLAILDVRMPGLSGIHLYQKLLNVDPSLPACFLSAFEVHQPELDKIFSSFANATATAGARILVDKPVTIDSLVKSIAPLLQMSRLGRAKSGDHILAVFETPSDLVEQALQFMKKGLVEGDEDVLLVTDQMPKETIREKMGREWNVDVKSLEASGRITLMTFGEWHFAGDGRFDVKRNRARFEKIVRQSIDAGRKGFRFVGDTNPFIAQGMTQELAAWEAAVGKKSGLPATILCAYTRESIRQLEAAGMLVSLEQDHNKVT